MASYLKHVTCLRFLIIRKVPETRPNVQFRGAFCRVSADEVMDKKGLKQATSVIEALIDDLLAANAQQVENYRAAEPEKRGKMLGFFVGQCMKASGGKANPAMVNQILKQKLDG